MRKRTAAKPPRSAAQRVPVAHCRAVADCTYDWESWHGPDGRLVWVNPAVERLTGYAVSACHTMPDYPLAIVAEEDRAKITEILTAAKNGSSGNDAEFRIVHQQGEIKWVAISWQPMFNRRREHLGFRTSVRDVTERRRLRDQLRLHLEQLVQERTARIQHLERHRRQMEKLAALGQLAAGVAHEINNPLAGVRNAFELIKVDLTPQHRHFELLDLIDREIERMSSIVHQMYQLYRRYPQAPTQFDVRQTVGEVMYLLERVARRNNVLLFLERQDVPLVRLPEGEVKQILYNLISNAIQASPASGRVMVRVTPAPEEVCVAVEDRGQGIADDVLPRIFDPFFSTKENDPRAGMGLGLSVSRNILEAMGGRIEVESQVGRGSIFTAVFPVSIASTQEVAGEYETDHQDPDCRR
jgi:two-component system sporulation sensor kinase C